MDVLTERLPIEENACSFEEGSSTMDPNCVVDELSGSLQSCDPFSVTVNEPSMSLVAPDTSGTEVLVGAFNSISIVESSQQRDDEGTDNVSRRRALTIKSNQKTRTRNASRKRGKTVVKEQLLDSVLLRVARKRRSYFCKPARASIWGSLGYITQVFEQNSGFDGNQNGHTKSRKKREVQGSGKRNKKNHSQRSNGKSCASSGRIRLKVTLGKEVIQSCLRNMVSVTDNAHWGTSIEVPQAVDSSEKKTEEEVPGINGYQCCYQDQEKVVMSSDAAHLDMCVLNKALEMPVIHEMSEGVNSDDDQIIPSQIEVEGSVMAVDNTYFDSGTSPDSEVINLIPEAQVNGKVQEDLYDVLSSSQACVAPGDVRNLDVLQISRKKGKKKNRLPHADNSAVEDSLPLPEIVNNGSVWEIQGLGEKMGDDFYSNEPSISTTIANVSGNTSCSEGLSGGPLTSTRVTDTGVPLESFKVGGGIEEDVHFKGGVGLESLESNNFVKLHYSKSKGRKDLKTSNSGGVRKNGSEPSDSPSSQNGNACKQKGNTVKSVRRRKVKDKGACDEGVCKVENYPETGDHSSADPEKIKTGGESTTKDVFDLDKVAKCVEEQHLPPRSAWVCCDDCSKWRRIAATLADSIEETNSRWICKDNMDKGFADCSIPQEMSNSDINAELQISDASCGEDASDAHLNSKRLEPKHSKVHQQSLWVNIKSNLFLHRSRKRQTIDEIMVCHCKPPLDGRTGCGDGCLNRMLNIECVRGTCPCGELCSNQQFQKHKYAKLESVRCGKKGLGLQILEDISEGRFIIEYVGEVLDMQAYEARQREYALMGHKHFYFMTLNSSEVIDACAKGNLGRFINHSCDPNCRTEKWMVNGEVCIGLFAIRAIKKGEELTFDYNYVRVFGAAAKECVCGSSQCRGYLGGDPQNTEVIVKGDSDEEYPDPVMLNEDGEINDYLKPVIPAASSFDGTEMQMAGHRLGNKDKMDKSATAGRLLDSITELQTAGIQVKDEDQTDTSATAVQHLEISPEKSFSKSVSRAQLHESLEMDNSVEKLPPVVQVETSSQLDDVSNKTISEAQQEFVQRKETSLQMVLTKPLSDGIDSKKFKSTTIEVRRDPKSRPRMKTSRSSSSVKNGKLSGNSLNADKSELMVNKTHVLPYKSRKTMEGSLNGRFEAVEEKLNELLDADGGISKRKQDATKGYLKLLLLTATSGDSGTGEAIQSNRDLSMILDALLKTRSRIVLVDIISKNGLQMLHNIMKQYRRNFNKIPILRKLLKVLEYLAVREILTLEHINGGPPRLGVESFRESILTLTEHDDKQVHQIARNFRDRWIPRSLRKSTCMDRSDGRVEFLRDSNCNGHSASYIQGRDQVVKTPEPVDSIKQSIVATNSVDSSTLEDSSASGTGSCPTNGTTTRKRKSRWDQPTKLKKAPRSPQQKEPETQPRLLQKSDSVPQTEQMENRADDKGQNMDEDVPPGFSPFNAPSVPSTASSITTDVTTHRENGITSEFPCDVVMGHPNGRFNNCLAVSFGIPLPVAQQFGIPQAETLESWIVAPGMPFQPFPPLPPHPRHNTKNTGEQGSHRPAISHSDQNAPSTSGARIPDAQIQGGNNQHPFQRVNGSQSLGRRYFRQQKWNNPRVGPPWIQRHGSGFAGNNPRNGMCSGSSVGVATAVNEINGSYSSERVNTGVQNGCHTFHQYPQQQNYH